MLWELQKVFPMSTEWCETITSEGESLLHERAIKVRLVKEGIKFHRLVVEDGLIALQPQQPKERSGEI